MAFPPVNAALRALPPAVLDDLFTRIETGTPTFLSLRHPGEFPWGEKLDVHHSGDGTSIHVSWS